MENPNLWATLLTQEINGCKTILLLALIGVVAFNIEATTIYGSLKVPINETLHPLQGESLEVFQEESKHIHYTFINGIRSIGIEIFV